MRRRLFLGGLVAAIAAPAIVARENIMAIKVARPDRLLHEWWEFPPADGRWLVIHPNEARMLLGVDHGRPEGDYGAMVRGGRIGQIERFTIYESQAIMDPGPIVASNYGRGPGVLTEDEKGVRHWRPQTAQEIRAKIARAERQLRAILEPKGSARWR